MNIAPPSIKQTSTSKAREEKAKNAGNPPMKQVNNDKKISKGQLISKGLFGVIVSTKKPMKFFEGFLP